MPSYLRWAKVPRNLVQKCEMPEFITFAPENIQFQKRKEHFLTPVCFKPQEKFTISQTYGFLSLLITYETETVYKLGSLILQSSFV